MSLGAPATLQNARSRVVLPTILVPVLAPLLPILAQKSPSEARCSPHQHLDSQSTCIRTTDRT